MKLSAGFSQFWPSVAIFVCYGISFTLLPVIMRVIDLSVTYAVWSGLGTFGTSLIGFWYFGEKATGLKVGGIGVILVGVVMLKWAEGMDEKGGVEAGETGVGEEGL